MDPFIGEIRVFAGSFIPQGYLPCIGMMLHVSSYPALAAIIGKTFGGDGKTTFMLPNLLGYAISGSGTSGVNNPTRTYGTPYGVSTNTIGVANLPVHTHTWQTKVAGSFNQKDAAPTGNYLGSYSVGPAPGTQINSLSAGVAPDTSLSPLAITPFGNDVPVAVDNKQPYLNLWFGIAWDGVFPPMP